MATIIVTGGAGFIGSHLCEELLKKGFEVLAVDNFFTGSKENISHLLDNKSFEIVRHDITQPLYLEGDSIYHLACPASPVHYQKNPIKTIKTNVIGTLYMLGLAKRVGADFLLASTSEVYGDPLEHPQTESYWGNVNPIGPRSCYDEGKRVAESLTVNYQINNGVRGRIARIFNTYGPRMALNDGRVVSNFIIQALKGKDLTVYGDGKQTRSFCFVSDMVRGLISLMEHPSLFNPVNLGNPVEITIEELAKEIINLTGSKSKIVYKEKPEDDPVRRKPDITLAKKELNWRPEVALRKGLQATIEYFDEKLKQIKC
ncbi:MAG: SDR family oxidoreductase [Candidatus Dadabacteria bacterium]|nr:MAG: SDR family oxidoreductase [Candidatus Dadabacteria bacterium]